MNIFLFHRDLRIHDNTALYKAPSPITPIFIFPEEQINPQKNKYFSHAAVQFMCESLESLNEDIRKESNGKAQLTLFHSSGSVLEQLQSIHKVHPIASITQNKDFTVYALERDAAIRKWCETATPQVSFNEHEDYDLVKADELLVDKVVNGKKEYTPYTVLAAYYKRFIKELPTPKVAKVGKKKLHFKSLDGGIPNRIDIAKIKSLYNHNEQLAQRGGRSHALQRLKTIKAKGVIKNYDHNRNYPALSLGASNLSTTLLSAHLKFGTISIREMYWYVVEAFDHTHDNPLVRELVFRSFYKKICSARPRLERDQSFRQDIDEHIPWLSHKDPNYNKYWKAWTEGKTGFPLVDAGMRQMNATGHMHGRVRMVAATVLTRYFLIDWREGARYFAQHLVDYDPCSNNMGWQFSAALGENSQNVYRAPMNPFLQGKTYDSDTDYIKYWIPELADITPKEIHTATWDETATKYPKPIIDQKVASKRAVTLWKSVANNID